jgi:glycosyltransferase involved in cell wall biosynthesis
MNPLPTFSIVTVCFNAETTIAQTIASVQEQRDVRFQHIIVDGGSTDGTMDIVRKHANCIDRIISEKDHGVYDAMQKGLTLAQGKYTGFLNADDFYASPTALARLAAELNAGDYLGITGVVQQINGAGKIIRTIGREPLRLEDLFWGKFPPHPSTYLRTTEMLSAGGFQRHYKIAGDFDLLIRLIKNINLPIAHLASPIVKMRMGGVSTGGLSAYQLSSRELVLALRSTGYPANPFKVHARILKKLPELLFNEKEGTH